MSTAPAPTPRQPFGGFPPVHPASVSLKTLPPPATLPEGYFISDSRTLLDLEKSKDVVWRFLNEEAYWGRHRTRGIYELEWERAWRRVGVFWRGEYRSLGSLGGVAADGQTSLVGPDGTWSDADAELVAHGRVVSDGTGMACELCSSSLSIPMTILTAWLVADLADIFVLPAHRGKSVSKCLVHDCLHNSAARASNNYLRPNARADEKPSPAELAAGAGEGALSSDQFKWLLWTGDGHGLYESLGFTRGLDSDGRVMERWP